MTFMQIPLGMDCWRRCAACRCRRFYNQSAPPDFGVAAGLSEERRRRCWVFNCRTPGAERNTWLASQRLRMRSTRSSGKIWNLNYRTGLSVSSETLQVKMFKRHRVKMWIKQNLKSFSTYSRFRTQKVEKIFDWGTLVMLLERLHLRSWRPKQTFLRLTMKFSDQVGYLPKP